MDKEKKAYGMKWSQVGLGWITRYGGHEKLICQNPRKLVNSRSLISNPNLTDTNPIFKG